LETQGKIENDLSRPQWLLTRRVLVAKDSWTKPLQPTSSP